MKKWKNERNERNEKNENNEKNEENEKNEKNEKNLKNERKVYLGYFSRGAVEPIRANGLLLPGQRTCARPWGIAVILS